MSPRLRAVALPVWIVVVCSTTGFAQRAAPTDVTVALTPQECATRVIPVRVKPRPVIKPPNGVPSFRGELEGKTVEARSTTPLTDAGRVVIVLDLGTTLHGERRSIALGAIKDLLLTLPNEMPVAFISHSQSWDVAVNFSSKSRLDIMAQAERLSAMPDVPIGRTPIVNQIAEGFKLLIDPQPGDEVYVITDGGSDSSSKSSWEQLTRVMSESGIRLNGIVLPPPRFTATEGQEIGVRFTEDFIETTGGTWIETRDAAHLRSRPELLSTYSRALLAMVRDRGFLVSVTAQQVPSKSKLWKLHATYSDGRPMHYVDVAFPQWWPACNPKP
jgi:hypothetical protein